MQLCDKLCKKLFHSYSKNDLEQNTEIQNVQLIKRISTETNDNLPTPALPKLNLIESTPHQSLSSANKIEPQPIPEVEKEENQQDPLPNPIELENNPKVEDIISVVEDQSINTTIEIAADIHKTDNQSRNSIDNMSTIDCADVIMKDLDESLNKRDSLETTEPIAQLSTPENDFKELPEKQHEEIKEKYDSESEDDDDDDYEDYDDNNKRLANKYGDLGGELLILNIPNPRLSSCNLGLRLSGNKDLNRMSIFICQIAPGSLADIDGRLQIGDEILEIDDHILYGRSHVNASPIIKSCYSKLIKFVIHRSTHWQSEMAVPVTFKYQEIVKKRVQFSFHSRSDCSMTRNTSSNLRDKDLLSNPSSRRSSLMEGSLADSTNVNNNQNCSRNGRKVSSVSLGQIPILPSISTEETHIAYLTKGQQGLGFAIMEGSFTNEPGIYIKHLSPMGPAAQDGSLRPGDKLVSINNQDVSQASYDTVLEMLRTCRQGNQLRIVISRVRCSSEAQHSSGHNSNVTSPSHNSSSGGGGGLSANHNLSRKRLSAPNIAIGGGVGMSIFAGMSRSRSPTITEENNMAGGQADASSRRSSHAAQNDDVVAEDDNVVHTASPNKIQIKLIPESESGLQNYARNMADHTARRKSSISNIPSPDLVNVIFNSLQDDKSIDNIVLTRDRRPLGMSIIGGCDTFIGDVIIHDIYPSGVVAQDGRIKVGDKIIMIDNVSVIDKTHDDVLAMLHSAEHPEISIKIRHQDTPLQDHDIYEVVTTVDLVKKPIKGLGISVIGREGAKGVYICDVVKGGIADLDGRIQSGDQILEINGQDFRMSSQQEAATKLKCLMGQVTMKIGRIHHLRMRFTPSYLVPKEDPELLSATKNSPSGNLSNSRGHSPGRSPLSSPAHAR